MFGKWQGNRSKEPCLCISDRSLPDQIHLLHKTDILRFQRIFNTSVLVYIINYQNSFCHVESNNNNFSG